MSERAKITMSREEVTAFLAASSKLQFATINPDGTPHLATMFYGLVDGQIAVWTYPKSQKARNIGRDPRVTCLIESGDDYDELRGVMWYGTVRTLTDPKDVRYVGSQVVRNMMDLGDDDKVATFVELTAAKRIAYIVEPDRIVSWDHRKLS